MHYRSQNGEVLALPEALRKIRDITRFNHLAVEYILEEGKVQGVEVSIGFPSKPLPLKELSRRIGHAVDAMTVKLTLQWTHGERRGR